MNQSVNLDSPPFIQNLNLKTQRWENITKASGITTLVLLAATITAVTLIFFFPPIGTALLLTAAISGLVTIGTTIITGVGGYKLSTFWELKQIHKSSSPLISPISSAVAVAVDEVKNFPPSEVPGNALIPRGTFFEKHSPSPALIESDYDKELVGPLEDHSLLVDRPPPPDDGDTVDDPVLNIQEKSFSPSSDDGIEYVDACEGSPWFPKQQTPSSDDGIEYVDALEGSPENRDDSTDPVGFLSEFFQFHESEAPKAAQAAKLSQTFVPLESQIAYVDALYEHYFGIFLESHPCIRKAANGLLACYGKSVNDLAVPFRTCIEKKAALSVALKNKSTPVEIQSLTNQLIIAYLKILDIYSILNDVVSENSPHSSAPDRLARLHRILDAWCNEMWKANKKLLYFGVKAALTAGRSIVDEAFKHFDANGPQFFQAFFQLLGNDLADPGIIETTHFDIGVDKQFYPRIIIKPIEISKTNLPHSVLLTMVSEEGSEPHCEVSIGLPRRYDFPIARMVQ